jgi:hypothetical protein
MGTQSFIFGLVKLQNIVFYATNVRETRRGSQECTILRHSYNVIINKTKVLLLQAYISCLGPLVVLLPKH